MNKILTSTKFVVDNSKFVNINESKIIEFSKNFEHSTTNHWLSQAPFDFSKLSKDEQLDFVFIFNSLSFCYWGDPKWTIDYEGKPYDGAWGMVVALNRAIKENHPLLDFEYCSKITSEDLKNILRGNIEIPLFKERLEILHEVGATMIKKYGGKINYLLERTRGDAARLVEIITQDFPSFEDTSTYKGEEIYFYKRAQLLASDLCQISSAQGSEVSNIDKLTACADYKLPQLLRRFGILDYVPTLKEKIDNKIEILHDSEEEIEIRANTIWAVELIKERVRIKNPRITSMGIDDHLWLASQEKLPDEKPYHRTRTVDY